MHGERKHLEWSSAFQPACDIKGDGNRKLRKRNKERLEDKFRLRRELF